MKEVSETLYTVDGRPYRWVQLTEDEIRQAIPLLELKSGRVECTEPSACTRGN